MQARWIPLFSLHVWNRMERVQFAKDGISLTKHHDCKLSLFGLVGSPQWCFSMLSVWQGDEHASQMHTQQQKYILISTVMRIQCRPFE